MDSDGTAIHYFDWGGDGPSLLLIHATGFLAALWRPLAELLTDRFRVVAVDQRGHGDSGKPPGGYRFETFAADLQRVIESLSLERPLAAGHSAGGTTIVVHAAAFPGVIERAVLIEPILLRPEWLARSLGGRSAGSLAEGARRRRAVWASTDEVFRAYRSRSIFASWRDDVLRLYAEDGTRPRPDGQVELKCPPEIEAQVFEAATHIDPWPMLTRMTCPTLALWGAESHLLGSGIDRQVQETVPQIRTVLVPGTSHFLPQEQPEEAARLMGEFLSDATPEPAEARRRSS